MSSSGTVCGIFLVFSGGMEWNGAFVMVIVTVLLYAAVVGSCAERMGSRSERKADQIEVKDW